MNSMDAYIYSNLYRGIDIDSYQPNRDSADIVPYKNSDYHSGYTQYVSMPYIPEPVILNDTEIKLLEWCISNFPI
jgi:hypothetical protein